MNRMNIYPGSCQFVKHPRKKSQPTLIIAFFSLISLFSILAFFLSILALIKK